MFCQAMLTCRCVCAENGFAVAAANPLQQLQEVHSSVEQLAASTAVLQTACQELSAQVCPVQRQRG